MNCYELYKVKPAGGNVIVASINLRIFLNCLIICWNE